MEGALSQIGSVQFSRDSHRERQFAGAIRKILDAFRGRAAAAHSRDSSDRLQRANQDAASLTHWFADEVQTLVHSINEIDVGVAGLSENHAGAIGDTAPGVRGTVAYAQVGFHFYDTSGRLAMYQNLAQAITRDFDSGPRVEVAIKQGGVFQELGEGNAHCSCMLGD